MRDCIQQPEGIQMMSTESEKDIRLAERFRTAEAYSSEDCKLHTIPITGPGRPGLSDIIERRWQQSLSFLVRISGAEEGLILRLEDGGMKASLHSGRKIAPFVPIAVPTTIRVSGISAVKRITNGIERKIFTNLSKILKITLFFKTPFGEVAVRMIPKKSPNTMEIAPDTITM